jgi:hypothetical protein
VSALAELTERFVIDVLAVDVPPGGVGVGLLSVTVR